MVKLSTILVGLLGLWQILCLVRICKDYSVWAVTAGVTYSTAEIIIKTAGPSGLQRYHVPIQGALIGILSAMEDTVSSGKSTNMSSAEDDDRLLDWKAPEESVRDKIEALFDSFEIQGAVAVIVILGIVWTKSTVSERKDWKLDATKYLDFENLSGFIVMGLGIVFGLGYKYNLFKTKTMFFLILFLGTLTGVFLAFAIITLIYGIYYVGGRPRLFSITVTSIGLISSATCQTFQSLQRMPSIFNFPTNFSVPKLFPVTVFHLFSNSTRHLPNVIPYSTQQSVLRSAKILFAKATMFALAHSLTFYTINLPGSLLIGHGLWDDCVTVYCGGYLLVGIVGLASYWVGLGMWLTAAGASVAAVLMLTLQPSTASWLIVDDLLLTVNFATVLS